MPLFAVPDLLLLFFEFCLELGAVVVQLRAELVGFLVFAVALGLSDLVLQGEFALGDFGGVLGIKFGERGFLFGGEFRGRRLFLQPFHREFVGGFHRTVVARRRNTASLGVSFAGNPIASGIPAGNMPA